jgi:hypothetical protein
VRGEYYDGAADWLASLAKIESVCRIPMPHPKEDRIRGGGVDMVKGGGRSTPKTRKCRDCDHQPAQKVIWARCPVCDGVMRVVRYD